MIARLQSSVVRAGAGGFDLIRSLPRSSGLLQARNEINNHRHGRLTLSRFASVSDCPRSYDRRAARSIASVPAERGARLKLLRRGKVSSARRVSEPEMPIVLCAIHATPETRASEQ